MRYLPLLPAGCAACLFAAPVLAQDISGKWYGTLADYSVSDPRRVLSIAGRGNSIVCTWDEVGLSIDAPAPCTLGSDGLDLVTASQNRVHLVPSGSNLVGSFTLTRNRGTYRIAMMRTPDFEVPAMNSTRICDQRVDYMPGVPPAVAHQDIRGFLGKWQGTATYSAVLTWCVGFVFQAIGKGNTISTKQAWSTAAGSGMNNTSKFGVSGWSGARVKDGILQLPGTPNSYEFQLSGPDRMSGFISQGGARYPVSLNRF